MLKASMMLVCLSSEKNYNKVHLKTNKNNSATKRALIMLSSRTVSASHASEYDQEIPQSHIADQPMAQ